MRIAIVGAGPAGAAAGWHLATRACRVTLIDRAAFPRDKTCGDWLTPTALTELAAIGLDRGALAHLAPDHAKVTTTRLVAPDGRKSTRASGLEGACIARYVLDDLARRCAVDAGCLPLLRSVRDLAELGAEFDCIVDARGAAVGVANAIGLRGYISVPRAALDADAAHRVEIHTDAMFRRGYGWIFPVRADAQTIRFNVGVGLWKADSETGRSISDFLDRFLEGNAVARELRAAAIEIVRPVGYPVGLGQWRNRVAEGRVLRIGDAANVADPLTGDGIGNALASGRLVAAAILSATDADDAARRWQRTFDTAFVPELRRSLALRHLLTATPAKNVAMRFLERGAPALGTRLHRAIFGETPYRDAWRVARAPPGQPSSPPKRS
jgi:menaquinone-9 beta-reductase